MFSRVTMARFCFCFCAFCFAFTFVLFRPLANVLALSTGRHSGNSAHCPDEAKVTGTRRRMRTRTGTAAGRLAPKLRHLRWQLLGIGNKIFAKERRREFGSEFIYWQFWECHDHTLVKPEWQMQLSTTLCQSSLQKSLNLKCCVGFFGSHTLH